MVPVISVHYFMSILLTVEHTDHCDTDIFQEGVLCIVSLRFNYTFSYSFEWDEKAIVL